MDTGDSTGLVPPPGVRRAGGAWLRWCGGLALALACACAGAAPEMLPLYTQYTDPPLDGTSPGNWTQSLAAWLSARSGGRYRFVATPLPRSTLDAVTTQLGWRGAVAWANPSWFDDADRQRFRWTDAYMHDANLLASTQRRPVEYLDNGRSLEGLRVGAIHGRRLPDLDWLVRAERLRRVDAEREIDLLRLLQAGQLDAALVQSTSLDYFRRELPGLDGWLHLAAQPRATFSRHLFTARENTQLRDFLNAQLPALAGDPAWRTTLPHPPRQLRLVSIDQLGSDHGQAVRRVLDIAFERAGLRYSLDQRPAVRALNELRAGQFDGDIARLPWFGEALPGVHRVGPAHSTVYQLAVVRAGRSAPRWDDLAELRVAVPRGFQGLDSRTRDWPRRELVDGVDACVRMVAQGRVEACLEPGYSPAEGFGALPPGAGLELHVLAANDVFLWLRPGLDHEARRLGAELAAMERSGELARLMGRFHRKAP